MHDAESSHPADLTGFEARLSALAPQSHLDRDRLMFAAGQQAARRKSRLSNRLLLATNFAFAGLAALLLANGRAASDTLVVAPQRAATSPIVAQAPTTIDSALFPESHGLQNASTNLRLRQQLSRGVELSDARWSEESPLGEDLDLLSGDDREPSSSRKLLKSLLESCCGQL